MKSSTFRSLALLACLMAPAHADERDALGAAAGAFCVELHRERVSGLPNEAQLLRLAPLMTPELHAIFQTARAIQQEQVRRHPDEKPDWVEGDLFSSSFEGVTSWEVGEIFYAPAIDPIVRINQSYAEQGQKTVTWTDSFVFKRPEGRWLLDDIRMGGEWEFQSGTSLRAILPGGGKESQDHTSLDGQWLVTFGRDGDETTQVALQPVGRAGPQTILFGHDGDGSCPMPTWVVWGPHSDKIALRLGDGPRFTRTLIFRLAGGSWQAVKMPEFHPAERKTMIEHGFEERDRLIDAEHWQDAHTLVITYFGSFEKGDEGDGFHQFVSVRIDEDGNARVIRAIDVPGAE